MKFKDGYYIQIFTLKLNFLRGKSCLRRCLEKKRTHELKFSILIFGIHRIMQALVTLINECNEEYDHYIFPVSIFGDISLKDPYLSFSLIMYTIIFNS